MSQVDLQGMIRMAALFFAGVCVCGGAFFSPSPFLLFRVATNQLKQNNVRKGYFWGFKKILRFS